MSYFSGDLACSREQILEHCRWLFGQEVQLILFGRTDSGHFLHAIILPKACSAQTLADLDFNEHILIKAQHKQGFGDVLYLLRLEIDKRINKILQVGPDGLFQVDKSAIPAKFSRDDDTAAKPEDAFTTEKPKARREIVTEQESDPERMIKAVKKNKRKGKKKRMGGQEPEYSNSSSGDSIIGNAPAAGADPDSDYLPPNIKASASTETGPALLGVAVAGQNREFSLANQPADQSLLFRVGYDTPMPTTSPEAVPTPNCSVLNDMPTTTPGPKRNSFSELNRKLVRDEINHALRGILSDMVKQITLQPEETQ